MKTPLIHCLFAMFAAGAAFGQDRPAFDAVSIKPSSPDARGGGYTPSPGRLTVKNQSLKDLVRFAYHLHNYQLSGGLSWTDTDRYEIVATFPAGTKREEQDRMMQSMLADRFSLTIRRESKEISGYVLAIGKNGPKLRAPESNEHEGMMLGRSQATGQRTLTATGQKMADVAAILVDLLGRPVEDKTALPGIFDFKMEWTPDPMSDGPYPPGVEKAPPPADGQTGPSLFTALQETLGLKLETGKVSVETIVIERAEKPSEN